jgi:hypothetical protein
VTVQFSEITVGTVVQYKSGGHAMTVDRIEGERAICVSSDGRRTRFDNVAITSLQPHLPYGEVGMLVIEGVTHTREEVVDILKEAGNA